LNLDPVNRLAWQHQAACRTRPASWWDATPGVFEGDVNPRAKAICHNVCPVRAACLEWALDTEEMFNILGGMLPRERAVELNVRRIYGPDYAAG